MRILFFFFLPMLLCTHTSSQSPFGFSGGGGLTKYDYGEFIAGKILFHLPACVSVPSNFVIKENMRVKKKAKGSIKNNLKKLAKFNKSDTVKKPDSFWTTLAFGLSFAALMLILKVPIAMLFFFITTGIGLGGYYIFRKKHKKIAEAFLTIATAINLGLGVVAVYGIWIGGVVD